MSDTVIKSDKNNGLDTPMDYIMTSLYNVKHLHRRENRRDLTRPSSNLQKDDYRSDLKIVFNIQLSFTFLINTIIFN